MARILIADDNASIRELMRTYLEVAGHVICGEAHDGIQAVELAKQSQPDLILLDLAMPGGMNGIETGSVLKSRMPEIPIILFTLHEEVVNTQLAAIMGVDLVLEKTKGIRHLAESVKAVLSQRVRTSQSQVAPERSSESSGNNADDTPKPH